MALIIPTPPTESMQALQHAVATYPEIRNRTGAINAAQTEGMLPHRVFTVGLAELVSGDFVTQARFVGWRYLIRQDGGAGVSAEVDVAPTGEHRFAQLNEGPFVGQTADLISQMQASDRVQNGTYELNVLRIPGIYVMALWLRDMNGGEDIVIPMSPTVETLEPWRQYDASEISPILAQAATERLGFDDAPRA